MDCSASIGSPWTLRIRSRLRSYDCCAAVMPSRAEGLGSSALLAMAYGLPVVASRVGGLPEVVEEDRTGWLVPANSSSALAEALVTAASDRERLARFGACARERVRAFSDDTMVSRTEALYLRLTAGLVIER